MGFYGNITNVSRTQFQFDKIYSNRVEMEKNKLSDGIFIGRYVLIEYDQNGLDGMKQIQLQDGKAYYNPKGDISQQTLLTINNTNNPEVVYVIETDGSHSFYIYQGEILDQKDNAAKFIKVINDKNAPAYTINYNIDMAAYGAGRGYDSTAWQKIFSNEQESYIMIAELNTVVPTFDVVADAPTMNPIVPHFDIQSTDVYYKLHWQAPWGFRVAAANNGMSDEATKWTKTIYNPDNNTHSIEITDVDKAAIYYNKNGFEEFIPSKDNITTNEIKITASGKSGNKYSKHDGTSDTAEAEDIQELTINLPAIGNMMSDAWDIIHGPNRDNARTDENGSLQGRLDSFKDMNVNAIPVKRSSDGTLVGSYINGNTAKEVTDILTEELSNSLLSDDAWIKTSINTTSLDNEISGISIHHTFHSVNDTETSSVVNNDGKINLYTPYIDAAGHVVGKNIETITFNISELLLTGYEKKDNNNDVDNADTLAQGLSKLQTQIHDEENARAAAADALRTDLDKEISRADAAEKQVLIDAKAYTDQAKKEILTGDSVETLGKTYDTLLEISQWIEGDGVNATELTAAIAEETKAREEDVADINTRIDNLPTYVLSSGETNGSLKLNDSEDVFVTGLGSAAYTDSTSYDIKGAAEEAENNAKAYADSLSNNYATAEQGALAETALQLDTEFSIPDGDDGSMAVATIPQLFAYIRDLQNQVNLLSEEVNRLSAFHPLEDESENI